MVKASCPTAGGVPGDLGTLARNLQQPGGQRQGCLEPWWSWRSFVSMWAMSAWHPGSSAGVVASSSFCREEAKGGAIVFRSRASFGHNKRMVVVGGLGWCLGQQKIPQLSGVKKNRSGFLKGNIEISEIIGMHLWLEYLRFYFCMFLGWHPARHLPKHWGRRPPLR